VVGADGADPPPDATGDVVERELTVNAHVERFPAMGTTAEVTVVGVPTSMLTIARGRINDLESRWSRFIPTSEIARLNAAGGAPTRVSPETVTLLRVALDATLMTHGTFDAFQLDAIEALGYGATFAEIGHPTVGPAPRLRTGGAIGVDLGADGRTVTLSDGLRFDPGGIGKGLAADLVAMELISLGAAGVCVNLGGDLRVAGVSPHGDAAWLVAVRDAPDDEPIAHVAVADGGVATTSRTRRRWTTADGVERHHLVDPATGRSARTPVLHATAIARDAWRAEVLSTVACLDGVAGIDFAERLGATAMIVTVDGVTTGASWAAYEHEPAIPRSGRS